METSDEVPTYLLVDLYGNENGISMVVLDVEEQIMLFTKMKLLYNNR